MRKIKFRAWEIDWKNDTSNEGKMRSWEEIMLFSFSTMNRTSYYIFMQYTGLLDKNGKEIYEGDILKITAANMVLSGIGMGIPKKSYDDLHGSLGEVYIEPGMTLVRHLPNESYRGHLVTVIAQSVDSGGNVEVIGNIYENPELLK